ncbi:hypothetical protein TorRG33x02_140060, partial [Trema orientale]
DGGEHVVRPGSGPAEGGGRRRVQGAARRECVEWLGLAVMTWTWAGLGFFLAACANLVPQTRATYKWYMEKFGEDYPKTRKAIIPILYWIFFPSF